jgi:phage replication O-like protein O
VGASPQAEDGHTDIANEVAEALARTNLSAYESRVLWVILRKTWGWHKKVDQISFTQFEKATGMHRRHIQRTLTELIKRNIVARLGYRRIGTYQFQKDYTKWQDVAKRGYDAGKSRVSGEGEKQKGERVYPKGAIDRNLKGLIQKKFYKRNYVEGSTELRLASLLLKEIRNNKPDFKEPNIQSWAKEIDLMVRRDKRELEKIESLILWVQKDSFWWKNVLSALKLRQQFDRLEAQMNERKIPIKPERKPLYKDLTGGIQE